MRRALPSDGGTLLAVSEGFVKICGITSEDDALLCSAMGADALGFIFAPSTSQVTPRRARDIVSRLPDGVLTVGVFRNEAPERVVEIMHEANLKTAQLHGHESEEESRWIAERVPMVMKAFGAGDPSIDRASHYGAPVVLVDNVRPGSGEVFDWKVLDTSPGRAKLVLAGGLDPDNVAQGIATVAPWGVDTKSGVEASPGKKDPTKVRLFVRNARDAFAQLVPDDADTVERTVGDQLYDWLDE